MSLPVIRSVSAIAYNVGGGLDRDWPTDTEVGDDAYLVCETANETVTAPSGFTQVPSSPQGTGTAGGTAATRLTVFHRRAASLPMPTITVGAAGNHCTWFAFFVRGGPPTGNPWDVTAGSVAATSSTAVSVPGGTTTEADCLIALLASHGVDSSQGLFSGWANAALGSLTVWMNESGTAGNGGGLALVTGTKVAAGVFGATTGTLSTTSVQGRLMLALRGTVAAPVVADSDFCCGAECGVSVGLAATPDRRHWHGQVGTLPVSQTAIARNGGRAWRFTPANAESYLRRTIAGNKRWARFYLYFATLPATDVVLLRLSTVGSPPELRYRAATQDIVGAVGTAVTSGQTVQVGVWYRVEVAGDVSTGTRTMKLTVTAGAGSEVNKGTASAAVIASLFTSLDIGASIGANATADMAMDDLRTGENIALYPVGAGQIIGLEVTADGTHSATGGFQYETGAQISLPGATDTWTYLRGLLQSLAGRLHASGAVTGAYLEWQLGGMPSVVSVAGAELVTQHYGETTTAHKQTLRIVDGGTVADVFTDADFSETSSVYHSRHYLLAPSGVAWTQALLNALKLRWGSSWTAADSVAGPRIAGVMLEVDHVPTPVAPPPQPRNVQHPQYTYAAAGTYSVRLRVTDNDGLTNEITKVLNLTGVPPPPIVKRDLVATSQGVGSVGAALEVIPATVTASNLVVELREAGVLRAARPYVPAQQGPVRSLFPLTAGEVASITDWDTLELWLTADGGNQAVRVTRARITFSAPTQTPSTAGIELHEGASLRAFRNYVPGQSLVRQPFALTSVEVANIINWNNLELWMTASAGTQAIRVTRARITFGAVPSPTPSNVVLELREGGTLRATRTYTPGAALTRTPFALTAGERASISNWDNLEVWTTADGGTQAVRVTRIRVVVP